MEIKRNLNDMKEAFTQSSKELVSISYGDKEKFELLVTILRDLDYQQVSISYGDKEKFEPVGW